MVISTGAAGAVAVDDGFVAHPASPKAEKTATVAMAARRRAEVRFSAEVIVLGKLFSWDEDATEILVFFKRARQKLPHLSAKKSRRIEQGARADVRRIAAFTTIFAQVSEVTCAHTTDSAKIVVAL